MTPPIQLLGANVSPVTQGHAIGLASEWWDCPTRQSRTIVTINVAILMMMRSNHHLADAVNRADLVVADGAPVVWASRWLGTPVPERVTGIDLMERLLAKASAERRRVFFLGTTQDRLDRLIEVAGERYPGIVIAGARNGFMAPDEHEEVVRSVRESEADILLVGMPAPFKEIWCEKHRVALRTPVVLGVGGAFDVTAGFLPRAPRIMRDYGFEWAWRFALEPRRMWRRNVVTGSQFIAVLTLEMMRRVTSTRQRNSGDVD